jgi:hypothetical protein
MFTVADAGNANPGPTVVPYNSNRFNAMPWDPGSGQCAAPSADNIAVLFPPAHLPEWERYNDGV